MPQYLDKHVTVHFRAVVPYTAVEQQTISNLRRIRIRQKDAYQAGSGLDKRMHIRPDPDSTKGLSLGRI